MVKQIEQRELPESIKRAIEEEPKLKFLTAVRDEVNDRLTIYKAYLEDYPGGFVIISDALLDGQMFGSKVVDRRAITYREVQTILEHATVFQK